MNNNLYDAPNLTPRDNNLPGYGRSTNDRALQDKLDTIDRQLALIVLRLQALEDHIHSGYGFPYK